MTDPSLDFDEGEAFSMIIDPHLFLESSVERLVYRIAKTIKPGDQLYFAGLGMDFDEFALPMLIQFSHSLLGVACVWTKPAKYGLSDRMRLFDTAWSYVESPAVIKPDLEMSVSQQKPIKVLVLCQSVIADEMETITALSLLLEKVVPDKILIASAAANRKVVRNLRMLGKQYFMAMEVLPVFDRLSAIDLTSVRDGLADRLDLRANKAAPRLSRWLAGRAFGPEPEPDNAFDFVV